MREKAMKMEALSSGTFGNLVVRLYLPDMDAPSVADFAPRTTTEQVKRHFFDTAHNLFHFSRDNFYMGISKSEVIEDESKPLLSACDRFVELYYATSPISLYLIPKRWIDKNMIPISPTKSSPTRVASASAIRVPELRLEARTRPLSLTQSIEVTSAVTGEFMGSPAVPMRDDIAENTTLADLPQLGDEDARSWTPRGIKSSILMQGKLMKLGAKRKKWLPRLFLLTSDQNLFYFKNVDSVPSGVIPLPEAFAVAVEEDSPKPHCFAIYLPDRTFFMSASNEVEMRKWMDQIKQVINQAKRTTPSPLLEQRKDGWLVKMGEKRKNWLRRWFVLEGDTLRYFKSPKEPTAKGTIRIKEVISIDFSEARDFCFSLRTSSRLYVFAASSEKEVTEWVAALSGARTRPRSKAATRATHFLSAAPNDDPFDFDWSKVGVRKAERKAYGGSAEVLPELAALYPTVDAMNGRGACELRRYARYLGYKLRSMELSKSSLFTSAGIQQSAVPLEGNIRLVVHVPFDEPGAFRKVSAPVSSELTMGEAIAVAFRRYARVYQLQSPLSIASYILLCLGRRCKVRDAHMDTPLYCFDYVRNCHLRGENVAFMLRPKKETEGILRARGTSVRMAKVVEVRTVAEKAYDIAHCGDLCLALKVNAVDHFCETFDTLTTVSVEVGVFYGDTQIAMVRTPRSRRPLWNVNNALYTYLPLAEVEPETRLVFTFLAHKGQEKWPLGYVTFPLFDEHWTLATGNRRLGLWRGGCPSPLTPCMSNAEKRCMTLDVTFVGPKDDRRVVKFPETAHEEAFVCEDAWRTEITESASLYLRPTPTQPPPSHPTPTIVSDDQLSDSGSRDESGEEGGEEVQVDQLITTTSVYELNAKERAVLWEHRAYVLERYPDRLPKLLQAVDWQSKSMVAQVLAMVAKWPVLPAVSSLQLLSARYQSAAVRTFAVRCLGTLPDEGFSKLLPQIVQMCKYELHTNTPLVYLLLERAGGSRRVVGHRMFWQLLGEMTKNHPAESLRYLAILEAYLTVVGPRERRDLLNQVLHARQLVAICERLKQVNKNHRTARLQEMLRESDWTYGTMTHPLDSSLVVNGFEVEGCRAFDSFTVPILLVYRNGDMSGGEYRAIFKAGDDLRQDALTLQMFGIMDGLWKDCDIDMRMTTYRCVPTGAEAGFIEVVERCETCANIQKDAGGAAAVFNSATLLDYLKAKSPGEAAYNRAVRNFMYSCAGSCVATYVLGIGDRHNDNVMLCHSGHIFHIDFGHFLGNVLKFGFVNRDKAPFCFTPEMAAIMGGRDSEIFASFVNISGAAYNVLRRHHDTFVSLFALMVSAGMPQLSCVQDIAYLDKSLALELTQDADASKYFSQLIFKSLDTKITQINFVFHLLAHPS